MWPLTIGSKISSRESRERRSDVCPETIGSSVSSLVSSEATLVLRKEMALVFAATAGSRRSTLESSESIWA